jgi:glycosyltransferase involved in cell wall biosynthesis
MRVTKRIDSEGTTTRIPIFGKRIAFVLYNYPLGVSTMLINSVALLAEHNSVDVYVSSADRRDHPCDSWLEDRLVSYPDWRGQFALHVIRYITNRVTRVLAVRSSSIAWLLSNLDVVLFSRWFRKQVRRQQYDILVAVECFSLIAIDRAGPGMADVIYYNMELLDWNPQHPLHTNKIALKRLECRALACVSHVMITSPERARIFSTINEFPAERVSALPVLPMTSDTPIRSSYFRTKFGISEDSLLVIYSGNFQAWAKCVEIIDSVNHWPVNAALVMHTWSKSAANLPYFSEMRARAEGLPVFFSTDYILHKDLPGALTSADIGLLFYEAIDANFTEILFSSNKMAEYMAAGLPVVCSPFPTLERFVRDEHIGIGCDFADIGAAIAQISTDIEGYRRRVDACRNRYFRFEPHFDAAFSCYAAHAHKTHRA